MTTPIKPPLSDPLLAATVTGLDMIGRAMSDAINRPFVMPGPDATKKRPAGLQDLDTEFSLSSPDQPLSDKQIAQYLAHGGVMCPSCLSGDITGSQFDVSEGCCWQNITCNACGATWTDEYELTTVSHFSPGVESNEGGPSLSNKP